MSMGLRNGGFTVRKAYILQYAPDGAYTIANGTKVLQHDADRQFRILSRGV